MVNQSFFEMLNSQPGLTMYPRPLARRLRGAARARLGRAEALYLPKLTSGQWTGTMCPTEPHCGTDLGLLRSKAEPQADGTYKITGQKIFISAGEHDPAENIVHLVLARLPDARPAARASAVRGAQVSPECRRFAGRAQRRVLRRLSSTRWVSTPTPPRRSCSKPRSARWWASQQGPAAMFVMMNAARLGVGMQSLGLTEVALPERVAYAKDRIQMRALSAPRTRTSRPTPSSCTLTCARCC